MRRIYKFAKKPWGIGVIVAIAAIAGFGGYYLLAGSGASEIDFVLAERGDVIQEVSVTGKVKPARSVKLGFERSGRVSSSPASVGDRVLAGEMLMKLESSELAAQLAQAEAGAKAQEAKLASLLRGSTEEEINVKKIKVKNATLSLEDAEVALSDKTRDAYTKADDAVGNKTDQMFSNISGASPQFNSALATGQLKSDIENGRLYMRGVLSAWQESLGSLETGANFESEASSAKTNLFRVRSFIDNVASAVNSAQPSSSLTQSVIDGYKSDINTARVNVNTAIDNMTSATEKMRSARSALSLSEEELSLTLAGATAEDVAAQKAALEEARAASASAMAALNKSFLYAPFSGVITARDVEVGEFVSAGENVLSLISSANYEMEAFVPEADIAKIKSGDSAHVTLDAYPGDVVFRARVIFIDPAETTVDGVSTYKTSLQFEEPDERLRSGLTANIDILGGERSGVVSIPSRAVITENGKRVVRILSDKEGIVKKEVKVGLSGSLGNVEIMEGVKEGDKIIIFLPE